MQTRETEYQERRLPFAPVTLDDKETVDRYMKPYGQNSCQHSFINLYTLLEKYDSCICEKNGFLFTLRRGLCTAGERVYLAPMGGGDLKAAYEAVLADAAAYNCKAVFKTITKDHVDFLKNNFPGLFEYTELRDYAEYIYDPVSLCRMEGKKFARKRNSIKKILRTYGGRLEVRPINKENISDVWEYERKWLFENAETHDEMALRKELREIVLQLDNFDRLGLDGICIYIDNKIAAYAYGTALNDDCFDDVIAKADRNIPDLYKLLYLESARRCESPYKYSNWEEDVGVVGLRNIKMEYDPCILLRKYLVKEKDVPSDDPETDDIPVLSDIDISPDEYRIRSGFDDK